MIFRTGPGPAACHGYPTAIWVMNAGASGAAAPVVTATFPLAGLRNAQRLRRPIPVTRIRHSRQRPAATRSQPATSTSTTFRPAGPSPRRPRVGYADRVMGGRIGPAHLGRGRLFVVIVLALTGTLYASMASGAAAKKMRTVPTTPICTGFSTAKISALLATGRMYLDHSFHAGPDSNCTYYGVTPAQASMLVNDGVPYNQIKYYPSLMISIQTTTPALLDVELGLLRKGYQVERVARALKPFSEEWFSSGTESGANLMPCESEIRYDNWLGGPECMGQPALKQVNVLGYIKLNAGTGRMVLLNAAQQSPPGSLSISHMLALAEASVEGRLY